MNNQKQIHNEGNIKSQDSYILNQEPLKELTAFIEKCVHEYFMTTINPTNNVKLKITQSWINWSKPKDFHHIHTHSNSYISGCYYVKANKKTDKIVFEKHKHEAIKFAPKQWNTYNCESWWYPVGTGELILFPSYLWHKVEPIEGNDTRISLAFNTFPQGHLGEEKYFTELRINELNNAS